MSYLPGLQRNLEPPEGETHAECESCGERLDLSALNFKKNDRYLDHPFCDECRVECIKCGQEDGTIYMRQTPAGWLCEECDED